MLQQVFHSFIVIGKFIIYLFDSIFWAALDYYHPHPCTQDPVEWSLGHVGLLETPQAQREMMHVIVNTPDGVLREHLGTAVFYNEM